LIGSAAEFAADVLDFEKESYVPTRIVSVIACNPETPEPLKARHVSLVQCAATLTAETDENLAKQAASALRNDYRSWLADYEAALRTMHENAFRDKSAAENELAEKVAAADRRLTDIGAAQFHVSNAKQANDEALRAI
jgi:hypothetical protein